MKAILEIVFHITNKIGDKIDNVYRNKFAMEEFFSLLNKLESTDEFEDRWRKWIENNDLQNNYWLRDMYNI